MINPIDVANWLQNNSAVNFKLAGVADDGEVFIEDSDPAYFKGADKEELLSETLRRKFPEIKKITFVVKPSLRQVEEMIQNLNKVVNFEQPKNKLLDIEEF